MIELRHADESRATLAFGGDTLNTAVYLARLGRKRGIAVDYATALGEDPYSEAMRAFFAAEGIGLDLVQRIAGRLPGLYAIRTDAAGERTFFYWRQEAAARAMFEDERGEKLAAALGSRDWIYLSGITLSILGPHARTRLMDGLDAARRRGAQVAFDANYRPRGWPAREEARAAIGEALRRADVALPTFGDEQALFGDAEPQACAERLARWGVREIVVKNGADSALVVAEGRRFAVPAERGSRVLDTTAAGDSFNAGYLFARLTGRDPEHAARIGHRLAAVVIQHEGAIIPPSAMPAID
jgi:2-dehydro-3-deoxygluconokinase